MIVSSVSAFTDLTDKEEILRRFLNFSRTTASKEMVPSQPQPTADSPHNPPITAADSKDPSTTVKDTQTTPFIFPDGDSMDEEVEYCFSFYTNPYLSVRKSLTTSATVYSVDYSKDSDNYYKWCTGK